MYIFFTYFFKKSFTITENHWENISLLLSDTCTVFTYIRGLTYDTHSEKRFLLIVWKECRHIKHTLPPYRCCGLNTQRVCQSLYVPANQTFKKKKKKTAQFQFRLKHSQTFFNPAQNWKSSTDRRLNGTGSRLWTLCNWLFVSLPWLIWFNSTEMQNGTRESDLYR